jgi:tRNA-2-methylthio-N6-dimethylallyladenosine synthase
MNKQKLYIETYGCQMNFADSEIVASVLSYDYDLVDTAAEADLILVNTCSIRDNAEQRVFNRLNELTGLKKKKKHLQIGLIGCMAPRLKEELFAKTRIDFAAGPDSYRNLPQLLSRESMSDMDIMLSQTETYEDISPVRYSGNKISAFVSVMRGCNNFCAYCVVPYTRGRERSHSPQSVVNQARKLVEEGYREITLLGQNVNSYQADKVNFASLIRQTAAVDPRLRVRFATSHPKDLSNELLETMADHPNICKSIHLPVQSGSTDILQKMNRKYTREDYLQKIQNIRHYMPDCSIGTDIIAGFCSETENDHLQTLSLMREVGFDHAFMFKYSTREGTSAHTNLADNVDEQTKIKRLEEIIALQQQLSLKSNQNDVGKTFEVLVESISKRSQEHLSGRTTHNKVVVFPTCPNIRIGDYVQVRIADCTAATLIGNANRWDADRN